MARASGREIIGRHIQLGTSYFAGLLMFEPFTQLKFYSDEPKRHSGESHFADTFVWELENIYILVGTNLLHPLQIK